MLPPQKKPSCAVGGKKIRAATLRRIRTCETDQPSSSIYGRKWYEESQQPKWYPNQILTENGKKSSQASNKNTQKSKQFFFVRNLDSNLTTRTLHGLQCMGRIGTLTSSRDTLNQQDKIAKRIQMDPNPLSIRYKTHQQTNWAPTFFHNLGHQQWQNQPFLTSAKKILHFFRRRASLGTDKSILKLSCNVEILWPSWAITKRKKLTCLFWYNDDHELMPIFLVTCLVKGWTFIQILDEFKIIQRLLNCYVSFHEKKDFFAHRKPAWPCTKVPELPFPKSLEAKLKRCFQLKINSWGSRKWFKTYSTLPEKNQTFVEPCEKWEVWFIWFSFYAAWFSAWGGEKWYDLDDWITFTLGIFFGWKNPGFGEKIGEYSKSSKQ